MVGLLIRHGHCDAIGRRLAGRCDGNPLNATGRREADELSAALRWLPITAIYSSPLERAVETAKPLARDHGLPIRTREALTDVDFGEWTGKSLAELAALQAWHEFNRDRCHACAPGGEPLVDVQRRIVDELIGLSRTHPGEMVAIVTHAEPISCAIAAFDCRTLDEVLAVEISPAHVSTVGIGPKLRRVLSINMRAEAAAV
jgi:broad specificity phosphatase PhoE